MVDPSRHDEEQVGQPVDIPKQDLIDGRLQRDHTAFRAAAHCPRQVKPRTGLDAACEDEVRERR